MYEHMFNTTISAAKPQSINYQTKIIEELIIPEILSGDEIEKLPEFILSDPGTVSLKPDNLNSITLEDLAWLFKTKEADTKDIVNFIKSHYHLNDLKVIQYFRDIKGY
jgi:hypothetical protein